MSADHLDSAFLEASFNRDVAPDAQRVITPPSEPIRTEADERYRVRAWLVIWILTAAFWSAIYLAIKGYA